MINNYLRTVILIAALLIFSICSASAEALLNTGEKAPDFSLKDMGGKTVSLSGLSKEKAVVLLFWSTWSANSPKALKRFDEYYRKYKDKGIQVLGVNADNQTIADEDMAAIRKLTGELNISFPVLPDRGLKTFHNYGIIALPSTVVITEGKISYVMPGLPLVGTEDLFDYLLMLAGEPPRKTVKPGYAPRYDAIANANLARRFVGNKMYPMAYPLFQKAIENDPKYLSAYIELARLYEREGKNDEAEKTLRKALSVEAENEVAMTELGHLLAITGKAGEAVEILNKAVKKEAYTPAFYYLGLALAKKGQLPDALKAFESAISLNPYDPNIYKIRAEVYENNKMLKEASADYKRALELILSGH